MMVLLKKYGLRYLFALLSLVLLGSIVLPSIATAQSASNTATWINMATISYQGVEYKENDARDDNWHFYATVNGCQQEIKGFNYNASAGPFTEQTVKLHKQKPLPASGGCTSDGTEDVRLLAQPAGFNTVYVWQDDHNIKTADGKIHFTKNEEGLFVSLADGNQCKDYITVGNDKTKLTLNIRSNDGFGSESATNSLKRKYSGSADSSSKSGYPFHSSIESDNTTNGCHNSKAINNISANATLAVQEGTSLTAGGSDDDENSCEAKGGSLGWIICPILGLLGNSIDWVEGQMVGLLSIDKNRYDRPELREAWGMMRNFAYLILVPMIMVMVISTALGFEFVSAYTVKTALPRMIIATIYIALSYDINVFIVDVVQSIGHGVQNLMLNPFAGTFGLDGTTKLQDILRNSSDTGGGLQAAGLALTGYGVAGYFIVVAGVSAALGVGLLSFIMGILGIVALTLFVIFLLLTFRQLIIVMLILLAPLAILAWIFPGRDKLFGLWNKTFWLMMWFYPLIMMAVAAGKILAVITLNT